MPHFSRNRLLLSALVVLAALSALGACQKKAADKNKPAELVTYNAETLKPVLGLAQDAVSGILDVTGPANDLNVTYRYYDVDLKNYEDDMVKEMAPKIEALYKKFKDLDRVAFHIITNNPNAVGEWKPFMDFSLTRKTVSEISWSGLLTADFFKATIELKRFD
jgi:hypothetical protein